MYLRYLIHGDASNGTIVKRILDFRTLDFLSHDYVVSGKAPTYPLTDRPTLRVMPIAKNFSTKSPRLRLSRQVVSHSSQVRSPYSYPVIIDPIPSHPFIHPSFSTCWDSPHFAYFTLQHPRDTRILSSHNNMPHPSIALDFLSGSPSTANRTSETDYWLVQ